MHHFQRDIPPIQTKESRVEERELRGEESGPNGHGVSWGHPSQVVSPKVKQAVIQRCWSLPGGFFWDMVNPKQFLPVFFLQVSIWQVFFFCFFCWKERSFLSLGPLVWVGVDGMLVQLKCHRLFSLFCRVLCSVVFSLKTHEYSSIYFASLNFRDRKGATVFTPEDGGNDWRSWAVFYLLLVFGWKGHVWKWCLNTDVKSLLTKDMANLPKPVDVSLLLGWIGHLKLHLTLMLRGPWHHVSERNILPPRDILRHGTLGDRKRDTDDVETSMFLRLGTRRDMLTCTVHVRYSPDENCHYLQGDFYLSNFVACMLLNGSSCKVTRHFMGSWCPWGGKLESLCIFRGRSMVFPIKQIIIEAYL